MKYFIKILLSLLLVDLSLSISYGQPKQSELSCTIQKAFPLGKFNDSHHNGSTITFAHTFLLSEKSGLIQSVGLSKFSIRNAVNDSDAKVYEIMAGYRYKPGKKFYIQLSPGLSVYKKTLNNESGFLLKLGTGLDMPLKKGGRLNILQQFCFGTNDPYEIFWFSTGLGLSFRIKKKSQINDLKK